MDVIIPFGGQALNAVDKKGRVSLPAELRSVVERRCALATAADLPVDEKLLYISEDETLPCLVGFDETEQFRLASKLAEDPGDGDPGRRSLVSRGRGANTFAPLQRVVFDKAGRMVLNGLLRDITGIGDFAFFVGNGLVFDIWEPSRAHAHYTAANDRRMIRIVEGLCKDKGAKL
ncbi:MAG: hypothetical protein HKN78_00400 [Sphingomonadaceae bacterium]|nr:hypothetical protein [Sphingomonadaceae bacterium]